jgi:hypothetical protein
MYGEHENNIACLATFFKGFFYFCPSGMFIRIPDPGSRIPNPTTTGEGKSFLLTRLFNKEL